MVSFPPVSPARPAGHWDIKFENRLPVACRKHASVYMYNIYRYKKDMGKIWVAIKNKYKEKEYGDKRRV